MEVNYIHNGDTVVFSNHVIISPDQLTALFRLKHKTTCTHSFLWSELLRIPEGVSSLTIRFNKRNFHRIEEPVYFLVESGFFNIETEDFTENDLQRVKVTFSDILPDMIAIVPMI